MAPLAPPVPTPMSYRSSSVASFLLPPWYFIIVYSYTESYIIMNHTALPAAGGCNLFFIEQPITSVDCNIYEAERIVLTCTIESSEDILDSRLLVDPGRIKIRWYSYILQQWNRE